MELKLFNSLTREKEVFAPAVPNRVTMYNCGPTVYSYAHIGNARAAVVADILFRVLRHIYGQDQVVYARNITDVDDKIIKAAEAQGVDISDITEKYARIYNVDLAALNCLMPTVQPKATENISGMIDIIQTLIERGHAYESEGHVFFDVASFETYGRLSGNTLEALKKGDRVGEAEYARKKNSADFVLWKPPAGDVGWEAPFGFGRPGWHIECSAMARSTLGETIDIHCGGVDLKFPHHENEIAQSECAHGKTMARFWVHNEFLNMGREKMSKSLGNVKLVHDLLREWDGEVIRLALLKAHYRSELIWTEDLLRESKAQLDGWYRELQVSQALMAHVNRLAGYSNAAKASVLLDDLATPDAISQIGLNEKALGQARREFESYVDDLAGRSDFTGLENQLEKYDRLAEAYGAFLFEADLLGLLQKTPDAWFEGSTSEDERQKIDALVIERDKQKELAIAAKKAGDKARMGEHFTKADAIRDQLKDMGIILEDNPDGTSWRRE